MNTSLTMEVMFGLFGGGSEKKNLEKKYEKLMKEAYKLSHTDRKAADAKTMEAEKVMSQLELNEK